LEERKDAPTNPPAILVIGGPRTGTTWVAEALSFASGALWINEPDNEWPDPFALRAKLSLGRFPILEERDPDPADYLELWRRAFAGFRQSGPLLALADRLQNWPKTRRDLWRALCDHANPRVAPWLRVLASLSRPPSKRTECDLVVVKSVHAPLALDWLTSRLAPRVLIVHRHPFNTIASWLEFGWGGCYLDTHRRARDRFADPWGFPELGEDRSLVSAVAWEVALFASVLAAAARDHPEWLAVSHETLCTDPIGGFRRVYADLGLAWTQEAERFVRDSNRAGTGYETARLAAEQPDRWKRRLSPEQVREIRSLLSRIRAGPGLDELTGDAE
jgi:Sulfotransferase family